MSYTEIRDSMLDITTTQDWEHGTKTIGIYLNPSSGIRWTGKRAGLSDDDITVIPLITITKRHDDPGAPVKNLEIWHAKLNVNDCGCLDETKYELKRNVWCWSGSDLEAINQALMTMHGLMLIYDGSSDDDQSTETRGLVFKEVTDVDGVERVEYYDESRLERARKVYEPEKPSLAYKLYSLALQKQAKHVNDLLKAKLNK